MGLFDFFRNDSGDGLQAGAARFDSDVPDSHIVRPYYGDDDDPLDRSVPHRKAIDGFSWYRSSGLIQRIVNTPVIDAVREWFDITIKLDDNEEESDLEEQIERIIMNRLEELGLRKKFFQLLQYTRLYADGAAIYAGTENDIPGNTNSAIRKIAFINVLTPEHFSRSRSSAQATAKDFMTQAFRIGGVPVDNNRLRWVCRDYQWEDDSGMSVPESIYLAIQAQNSGLRTAAKMADELFVKILKSDADHGGPEKEREFLRRIKRNLSSMSILMIGQTELFERPTLQVAGIKELLDFIWENIASLTGIPKMRLMGNSQGAIAGADNDMRTYYDMIRAEIQEGELRPILDWLIGMIVKEQNGEIFRLIGNRALSLDWEIEWNSLWQESDSTKAEIELKQAQRDKLYFDMAVLSPEEIRSDRFEDLAAYNPEEGIGNEPNPDGVNTKSDGSNPKPGVQTDTGNVKGNPPESMRKGGKP